MANNFSITVMKTHGFTLEEMDNITLKNYSNLPKVTTDMSPIDVLTAVQLLVNNPMSESKQYNMYVYKTTNGWIYSSSEALWNTIERVYEELEEIGFDSIEKTFKAVRFTITTKKSKKAPYNDYMVAGYNGIVN